MKKRIVVVVLVILCIVSFASLFNAPDNVQSFKLEQIGVKM